MGDVRFPFHFLVTMYGVLRKGAKAGRIQPSIPVVADADNSEPMARRLNAG